MMTLEIRRINLFRLILITMIVYAVPATALSQQIHYSAPHKPIKKRTDTPGKIRGVPTLRSSVGGFWMIDANYKASIHVTNQVDTASVTVTPIVYLSNGKSLKLNDLALKPNATAIVNINQALQDHQIAGWASLYGYVELQYTWPWDPVCASVVSVDVTHSVIFTSGLMSASAPDASLSPTNKSVSDDGSVQTTIEGLWWKEKSTVEGFVALANASDQSRTAVITTSDDKGHQLDVHSVSLQPHTTHKLSIDEIRQDSDAAGGIRVTFPGTDRDIIVYGGLLDTNTGYSSAIPLRPAGPANEKPDLVTYAELGLMTGPADPMMGFSTTTSFQPFSVIRNASEAAVMVSPILNWMAGGTPHTYAASSLSVAPQATTTIDMVGLLKKAGLSSFSGTFNLSLEVSGARHALLFASGSVDNTKTYVFQTVPRLVAESASRSISYWSTGNGDDTMVTIWNPADESQEFLFTLLFDGGRYKLPVHLAAKATRFMNISQLIHDQVPDMDGVVIPHTIHEGSARLTGTKSELETILASLDSGVYNVKKATCSYYCISCDGVVHAFVDPNPGGFAVLSQQQYALSSQWNTGWTHIEWQSTFSGDNDAIATVANGGLATGVASGQLSVTGTVAVQVYQGSYCAYDPSCGNVPYSQVSSSSPTTVNDPNSIRVEQDSTTVVSCGGGIYLNQFANQRQITYSIQSPSGTINQPIPIYENVPPTNSSCYSNPPVSTGSTCTNNDQYVPNVVNEFSDFLRSCPTIFDNAPCGFSFANQQWQYCHADGTKSSIGTVGPVQVLNNSVTVNGNNTSLPQGTVFY